MCICAAHYMVRTSVIGHQYTHLQAFRRHKYFVLGRCVCVCLCARLYRAAHPPIYVLSCCVLKNSFSVWSACKKCCVRKGQTVLRDTQTHKQIHMRACVRVRFSVVSTTIRMYRKIPLACPVVYLYRYCIFRIIYAIHHTRGVCVCVCVGMCALRISNVYAVESILCCVRCTLHVQFVTTSNVAYSTIHHSSKTALNAISTSSSSSMSLVRICIYIFHHFHKIHIRND